MGHGGDVIAELTTDHREVEDLFGRDEIADKEIEDHAEAERIMEEPEGAEPDGIEFDRLMTALMTEIRSHAREEEDTLFPRLRTPASEDELTQLGDKVRQAKKTAPTCPHPSAPDTQPANELPAPGAGMVDRVRDALTGRGKG
jgi:hypothetical protein